MSQYGVYLSYKQVQDGWLFKVPEHWKIKKLKYIAFVQPSNVDKKSVEDQSKITLCNYTDVYYNEVISPDMDFMNATATNEQISRFSLKSGDVIITKDSEDPRDIAVPAFVPESIPSVLCGYHLAVVRHKDSSDGEYIFRYFQSSISRGYFFCAAKGLTRFGIGIQAINELPVALPPKNEQKAIASFLDREITRIDALIEKKERLIELLQEKRQAIITQAVTKGLVPSVPMKDSWIGWLGEVPEHWEIVHIKRALERSEYGISASLDETEGVAVLRMGNLKDGEISLDNLAFMEHVPDSLLLQADDLLFNRTNSLALVGRVGIFRGSNFPVTFASYLVRLITRPNFSKGYLCFLLNQPSVLALARSMALPAIGQANLNPNRYGYMRICKPPFDEQKAIAAALYKMKKKMTTIIGKIETSINLLKERRSALITTAVTGQIDVREEVA